MLVALVEDSAWGFSCGLCGLPATSIRFRFCLFSGFMVILFEVLFFWSPVDAVCTLWELV